MGAASGNDLAATLGRHARTEAVAALANQLARLIRPLHGTSPVEWGSGARRLAPVWLGRGFPRNCLEKTISAPRRALSACGLMKEWRGKVNAASAFMRQSGSPSPSCDGPVGLTLSGAPYHTGSRRDRKSVV